MPLEHLKDTALPHALSNAVGDLAELVQKELRLARAEISEKISTKLQATAWLSAAAAFGLITAILAVQALVFGIASFGIAMRRSWRSRSVSAIRVVVLSRKR